ncbi:MAG: hypothetical protein ACJA14_001787 [Ilumatobacter sp.]
MVLDALLELDEIDRSHATFTAEVVQRLNLGWVLDQVEQLLVPRAVSRVLAAIRTDDSALLLRNLSERRNGRRKVAFDQQQRQHGFVVTHLSRAKAFADVGLEIDVTDHPSTMPTNASPAWLPNEARTALLI